MNQDRFKFRVWHRAIGRYLGYEDGACLIDSDGDMWLNIGTKNDELVEKPQPPYIIEQCTGLKDCNGKLIYEGDVVFNEHRSQDRLVVTWRNGCFYAAKDNFFLLPDWDSFTIIGNIHENPDLLEQ